MRKPLAFDLHPMQFEPAFVRGVCEYVVDGDTCDVLVDEGFYDYAYITVRIKDFNAPELNSSNATERVHAFEARRFAESVLLQNGGFVRLITFRDRQTFGRFVADLWYWNGSEWKDFVETMKANGFERRASYE
jgi:endonuclease YncB( thermonuclease family)